MSYVLSRLRTTLGGYTDDIIAFLAGALDGYLCVEGATQSWAQIAFLAKNIGIPVLDFFMRGRLPRGLVHECEGFLGATIVGLLMKYVAPSVPSAEEGAEGEQHL